MEIALNSTIASSAHAVSIIGEGNLPALLDQNVNICKDNCNTTNNNNILEVSHSILNLFGTPTERYKEEINALASLTLKHALNVNISHTNGSNTHKVVDNLRNNEKLSQCNNNDRPQLLQHKHTNNPSKSSELLAALRVKKVACKTSKQSSKANKSLNLSSTSSVSSTSSSASSSTSLTSSSGSSISTPALSNSPSTTSTTPSITTLTTTTKSSDATFATKTILNVDANILTSNSVASVESGSVSVKNGSQIPSDILDDLASRFIINVPDMELNNMIRICFQIELAHWFYLDFFCASAAADSQKYGAEVNKKRKLPSCGIKQFALQLFQHIPFLREHLTSMDKIFDDWKNYKLAVPTFGAILISEDLNFCLLVQSYFAKCSWGFPKGKVNENEDPVHCATREVYEETGYDITHLIVPNDYIEAVINYQYTRLYIVRDVSLQTQFSPRTRNEIKCCDWFPIDSLPINKNDAISKAKLGLNANSFFMIMPFIKRLKRWVHDKRSGIETRRKFVDGEYSNTPITLMATAAVAAAAAVGGIQNCNNNQKQSNAPNNNSSISKKTKHNTNNNKNDEKHNNAASAGIGNTTSINNGNKVFMTVTSTSTTSPAITVTTVTTTTSNKSDNSKRSKRQRHKSMGDLDGIKLNNLSSNKCSSITNKICKNVSNPLATASKELDPSASELSACVIGETNNCKTVATQKRHGNAVKLIATGSSNIGHKNSNPNSVSDSTTSIKRQLFHSQSQNGCNQNGEKIVSSFDLIRKEKQQQFRQATAQADKGTKAQRQQQQIQTNVSYNDGGERVRTKSQSDKMCVQQQKTNTSKTNTNINGGNFRHVVQNQATTTNINSNVSTNNINDNNANILKNIMLNNNIKNTASQTAKSASSNPSITSGSELLAFAAETALSNLSSISNTKPIQQKQKRPASVALHFETRHTPALGGQQEAIQQLQRMASSTNLRILKRSTSLHNQEQQVQQLQEQTESKSIQQLQPKSFLLQSQHLQQNTVESLQQQQQTDVKFKPSFNSWTNFSFTKNFIANVFC